MKTAMIYDTQEVIEFFVFEGDYTHLDDVFINSTNSPEQLQQELLSLMYNKDKERTSSIEKFKEAIKTEAKLIYCGELT